MDDRAVWGERSLIAPPAHIFLFARECGAGEVARFPMEDHKQRPEGILTMTRPRIHALGAMVFTLVLTGLAASAAVAQNTGAIAGPSTAKPVHTKVARVKSTSNVLDITVNGKVLRNRDDTAFPWTLSDQSPDVSDLGPFNFADGTEICLVADAGKACHALKKGVVGVYVVEYRGKSYLAHLTI
ncbi:hypothetical protein [Sphingomonas colocasiae]|uniref:Uncharacterized protein n=1 Tax=Sphingomonas colocasiae TaxID=1848973 RepID=A0ABS7PPU1_9SPHN|nr:hypothetical protein [Sphingomonas colocasiae]MBY8823340.1 hypothetical protein [Sphingomonas colocasiae]